MLILFIKNDLLCNKINTIIWGQIIIIVILRAKYIVSFALNNPNTYY